MSDIAIVGDCGGTNTRLSLWDIPRGSAKPKRGSKAPGKLVFDKKYENENFKSFLEIVKLFLEESKSASKPKVACLACAGPIIENSCDFTNVGWNIQGKILETDLGIERVVLVNDFTAMGYGLLTLDEKTECLTLNDVKPDPYGVIATIGAGTGLGECFLTRDPSKEDYVCFGCEGGHTDYAPHTDLELEILIYAREKYKHKNRVSVERLISGPGISLIYEFLSLKKYPEKVDKKVHEQWEASGAQRGGVVAMNAANCELCAIAMDTFFHAYASEAGNAMLKFLPTGGFYLTGGINAKNMQYYTRDNSFLEVCLDKGRVSPALTKCPIHVVKADDVGERGAHLVAFNLLN